MLKPLFFMSMFCFNYITLSKPPLYYLLSLMIIIYIIALANTSSGLYNLKLHLKNAIHLVSQNGHPKNHCL